MLPPNIIPFPKSVKTIQNFFIPLSDGTELSARLWIPTPTHQHPTILEYIPYGKSFFTSFRDEITHPYLSANGYVCLRVDMRGSADSTGLLSDEYLPLEQTDCLEVIDWVIKQEWSDGKVGMMGISWGGFNSLQVAFRGHPALKAIITLCSTDDRHYHPFSDNIYIL